MVNSKLYGVFPAFYACYDENGEVSPKKIKEFTAYLVSKDIKGLYIGGSSGECIYHSVEERKLILENVMEVAKKVDLSIIAHVACNNTRDSMELAAHAEKLGVDAIAAIPPIYFHLPARDIIKYWQSISEAAPNTDFIIYNIPQLAGVALSAEILKQMKKNPRVIAVKNSSMPVFDITLWRNEGVEVYNGPDEQFLSGLAAGAVGGIGGTYSVMPELFLKIYSLFNTGEIERAQLIQDAICRIIRKMASGPGNMYAVAKQIIKLQNGPDIGGVREPLANLVEEDYIIAKECNDMIQAAIVKYCG